MSEVRAAGAIYDLGYQRYAGTRLGRAYAFRTLALFSFRSAFGLGRAEKAKSMPVLVSALVFLPTLIQIGIASSTGMVNLITYANQLEFTAFVLALFAASQAPELIVNDRQQGVLALYLSRPMSAVDYALAKLVALTGAMLVLTLGPKLILFLGKIFLAPAPWPAFTAEWVKLFPILGGSLLISLFFAAIGLALSASTTRRGYASASVIAFFLIASALAQIFRSVGGESVRRYAVLANPALLISGFSSWLFNLEAKRRSAIGQADLPGSLYLAVLLAVTALAIMLLLRRYSRENS